MYRLQSSTVNLSACSVRAAAENHAPEDHFRPGGNGWGPDIPARQRYNLHECIDEIFWDSLSIVCTVPKYDGLSEYQLLMGNKIERVTRLELTKNSSIIHTQLIIQV